MFIYFQAAVSALLAVSVLYVGNQPVTDISEAVIADQKVHYHKVQLDLQKTTT